MLQAPRSHDLAVLEAPGSFYSEVIEAQRVYSLFSKGDSAVLPTPRSFDSADLEALWSDLRTLITQQKSKKISKRPYESSNWVRRSCLVKKQITKIS